MDPVTVVGGGLAGLIAATECAEAGVQVRVLEARSRLGGRSISAPGPYVANFGPHALYTTTALWDWLRVRGLHRPCGIPRSPAIKFRWHGELRRVPPAALRPTVRLRSLDAPIDADLRSWLTDRFGVEPAAAISGATGALTFDHDPGRLSAAFVTERLRRIILQPRITARYVTGGWSALVDRVATHARSRGVVIETGAKVASVDELGGPVIVAVEPGAARRLLGDAVRTPESPRVAMLDIALEHRRGDPYLVIDLDEAIFVSRATSVVKTLAPDGVELVQASGGLRPGEDLASGEARIEAVFDLAFPAWRERTVWRRRGEAREATGALDLPGATWRDRQPIEVRDGVWLAGDWVAAPGHLAEVSCTSAVRAAANAVAAVTGSRVPAATPAGSRA